jgi:hypothetical protein
VAANQLHRGDLVEVKSPAEILATLDERGDLDGLPFMPEMAAYCGRRFIVQARADKVCDTVQSSGSRRIPSAVLLDDLRCDGCAHGGCQAECRFFWKEAWLEKVTPGVAARAPFPESDRARLLERMARYVSSRVRANGQEEIQYRCQGTEIANCSQHLRTFDPRPYVRELASGDVSLGRFVRVMAKAAVVEPKRKLGLVPDLLTGNAQRDENFETLGLQVGELVRVKSREEIVKTLTPKGTTRGLRFDHEMFAYCGRTFRVRARVRWVIHEVKRVMVELRTDAVILEGAACAGDCNPARWFCPRGIYPFWRECWLERVEAREAATEARPPRVHRDSVQAAQHPPMLGLSAHGSGDRG